MARKSSCVWRLTYTIHKHTHHTNNKTNATHNDNWIQWAQYIHIDELNPSAPLLADGHQIAESANQLHRNSQLHPLPKGDACVRFSVSLNAPSVRLVWFTLLVLSTAALNATIPHSRGVNNIKRTLDALSQTLKRTQAPTFVHCFSKQVPDWKCFPRHFHKDTNIS